MTAYGLHSKAAIADELAYRDYLLKQCQSELAKTESANKELLEALQGVQREFALPFPDETLSSLLTPEQVEVTIKARAALAKHKEES